MRSTVKSFRRRAAFSFPAVQRGVATILLILMVGLMLTVIVLGTSAYLRQQQAFSVSTHAQTQAQLKVWTGAELVRQYLEQVQAQGAWTQLAGATLPQVLTLQGDGVDGQIQATLMRFDAATKTVTAQIAGATAQGSPAEAHAMLEVVYALEAGEGDDGGNTGGGSTQTPKPNNVISFSRNLRLGGNINVLQDASAAQNYEISVLGDVSTGGNSITGVKKITSTGSIRLSSGSHFEELHANCDVYIDGSVTATTVLARRNACVLGGAKVSGTMRVNGSAKLDSSMSNNGAIYSRVNALDAGACSASGFKPSWDSAQAETCATPVIHGVDLTAGSAGAQKVETLGNVSIASGSIAAIKAHGDLDVSGNASVVGSIGGLLRKPDWNQNVKVDVLAGALNIAAVSKVELVRETFNANDVRTLANYVFFIDTAGAKKVTVRHVNGVKDGEYYLADYASGAYKDRLCSQVTGSGLNVRCADPFPEKSITVCKGYSTSNNCFSYDARSQTWSINGVSAAQGVAWFQGNLVVGNGVYYNTFIASGNIATSGSTKVYAPNYGGYSGLAEGVQYAPTGICDNVHFPLLYPLDLCNKNTQEYLTSGLGGLGNYTMMAGSRLDEHFDDLSGYVGGNIAVGASVELFGSVKAGNEFNSGGSTTVHGYATALALGKVNYNSMGGSTTFDLRKLPPTMQPGGESPSQPGDGDGGSTDTEAQIRVKWSRYL